LQSADKDWVFFYLHQKCYAEMADRFYMSIIKLIRIPKKMRGINDEAGRNSVFTKRSRKI